jgi:hypothetical protein
MTYSLAIGTRHVGPFPTAAAAQYWAETHGVDDWNLVEVDDPAEAPIQLVKVRQKVCK